MGGTSDRGLIRENNEDAWVAAPPLFAVADGMGGRAAGEVASRVAIDEVASGASRLHGGDTEALRRVLIQANARIWQDASADPALRGMGTTCTVVWIDGAHVAHVAHVGDSRAYLVRGGQLEQLTTDHTLAARIVADGRMTAAEAEMQVDRSVITRALGARATVDVDVLTVEIEPSDRLMLCSDGLTIMVPSDVIRRVLVSTPDPQRAADELVELARQAGGEDNVTVVVVDPDALAVVPVGRGEVRRPRRAALALLALAVLLAGAAAGSIASGLLPPGFPGAASPTATPPSASPSTTATPSGPPSPTPTASPARRPTRPPARSASPSPRSAAPPAIGAP